jgi:hemolysin activation/secretion protein
LLSSSVAGRHESGGFADVLGDVSARYYYRQSERRLLFLGASADVTSSPDLDHQLLLGGDNGLRGYPLRYQAGEGRWLVTAEQRWYSNWYPFRLFNVGGAVFYDMGGAWGSNPTGSPPQGVLRDVGVGLRLCNSRSALGNVLHVDVAFPLDGDKSISKLQFLVETQRSF